MTNHAIARAFTLLGDLLEIQGENVYKVRAYRKAAEEIEGLTENLESIAARGELEKIPGIGKAIAGKIQELCASGKMKALEEARAKTPEGLVELLGLPGFGPRKVQFLHEQLAITTLDQLEHAARENRLTGLPFPPVGSAEEVVAKIQAYRRRGRRWPIGRALPYAASLARALAETGSCDRVEVAGSVRRMADTTGDLNLVAAARDLKAAAAAFAGLGELREITAQGEGFIQGQSHAAPAVTLLLASPAEFPHLLRAGTGSPAHNEQLAGVASRNGLHFDERGILRRADGTVVAAEDEGLIFTALGLPWIAPELREGRGEVEAAAAGELPELITEAQIRGILHSHSDWSDGTATIAQMASAARALGHELIAMTDHSRALGVAHGLDEERLRAQMAEIDQVNAVTEGEFRILKGIEVDILGDGSLDLPEDLLGELDVVIGSVHSHFRQDEATITARMIRAMESGCVDIVAHPTGRLLGVRDPYAVNVTHLIEAAARTGTALEINAHPERLDLNDLHAREASEAGVPISINTDAHHPDHLGMLLYGVATARRAWLTPEQVINTWPLPRLREWLGARRGRNGR